MLSLLWRSDGSHQHSYRTSALKGISVLRVPIEREHCYFLGARVVPVKENERGARDHAFEDIPVFVISRRSRLFRQYLENHVANAPKCPFGHTVAEPFHSVFKMMLKLRFDAARQSYLHALEKPKRFASRSKTSAKGTVSPFSACAIPASSCMRCSIDIRS